MNDTIVKQQKDHYGSYKKIKDNPRYKKIWKFIIHNDLKGRLLDIGCADGSFSLPLIRRGLDCYGLEVMEEAVRESEEKGIKVTKGSFLEPLPFRDNFFDIVFAGEVVEHTVDDAKFLLDIYRVLKPGGFLILTTPNLVSFSNRFLMLLGRMPRFVHNEFHYKIYNSKVLSNKMKSAGFTIDKISSSYILISSYFIKSVGVIGEYFGDLVPLLGEHLIIYARKTK